MPDDQRGAIIADPRPLTPIEERVVRLFELLVAVEEIADEIGEYAIGGAAAIGGLIAERRYHDAYMRFLVKSGKKIGLINNGWESQPRALDKLSKKSTAKLRR